MPRVRAEVLAHIVETVLEKVPLSARDVSYVRDGLVEADLRGVSTHGVFRLQTYVDSWRAGTLNPRPQLEVSRRGAVGTIDGDRGLGHVVGREAMRLAIDLAADVGVGVVVARSSNHTGMLAQHVLAAIEAGMVGCFLNNGPAVLAPAGAREAVLSNNPVAYGIPADEEDPIVLDIAMSAASRGKVRDAARRGEQIPDDWATGPDGAPTTDPHRALEGTLLPFGGHKGFGLATVHEALAGVLSGALMSAQIIKDFLLEGVPVMQHWDAGHFAVALDLAAFGDPQALRRRVDELIQTIRGSGDEDEVRVPGQRSARLRRERLQHGVPLEEAAVASLRAACAAVLVPWDDEWLQDGAAPSAQEAGSWT